MTIDVINGIPGSRFTRDLEKQTLAFQQFADLVSAAWNIEKAVLRYCKDSRVADPTHWWLIANNRSDMQGAGGYHDEHPNGLPFARVFVGDAFRYGFSATVDMTHELAEMMVDPEVNTAPNMWDDGAGKHYLIEVGDPVEDDQFGFEIDGVLCTDFVLPTYYGHSPNQTFAAYDHQGHLAQPCPALLHGGYISWEEGGQWKQSFARLLSGEQSYRSRRYGRMARRAAKEL